MTQRWSRPATPVARPGRAVARLLALAAAVLVPALVAGCTSGAAERAGGGAGPSPAASAPAGGSPAPEGTTAPAPGEPRTLVDGLRVPWAIAFLPGGDALVTERDTARLLRVTRAGKATEVGVVEGVVATGEGGLLGVAVSPEYERDRQIFVYFTAETENRVVRYRYDGGLSDARTILSGIPKGGNHNGGRLEFGPDGYLYASTGEAGDRPLSQALGSLGGKILRMTADGRPAPGNPFQNVIWSYGHRNVQGMAWDDEGRMYASEFGQNTYDEVNLIEKGRNYGWPEVEGVGDRDGFTDPLVTWTTDEASPSGLAYANGSLWMAALRGTRLWQVPVSGGRAGEPVAHYDGRYGRLRAIATAPDGSLYVSTSNQDGRGYPAPGDDRILLVPAR
ncbi:PQQ-dependent sugar dehydrogenase [Sphaerisporangium sp. TRM90804]|uniref:PQQ-dependent sugar dehydrogenase n=1 Tax=Sphaerisporangium sp. TRM90804 TaxID=3031113 RepID=UPI002449E5AD|nr:PQQ-dependent sugar dehydrogenase [Sphaerisporangium sp. TRM90804]MDH2427637.1 PQQ-dependent sugar dehydrogenase [Sphaerisporangium sp. TRM90804]